MSERPSNGGEAERLAPVIPLFGRVADPAGRAADDRPETPDVDGGDASSWHTTWTTAQQERARAASAALSAATGRGADGREAGGDVRPLRAVSSRDPGGAAGSDARRTRGAIVSAAAGSRDPAGPHDATRPDGRAAAEDAEDATAIRFRAEKALLRKLRGRSLSVREARSVLREAGLDETGCDEILAEFVQNGYLDDTRLAEQLLDGALGRKAQGATAIAQTLSRRGLDREVIDIALGSLPDDEEERALDFARQRVRGMDGIDRDAALRRLHGQLARRGFRGSLAMSVARQALDEYDRL